MKRLLIALFVLLVTASQASAAGSIHPFADVAVSFRYVPHKGHADKASLREFDRISHMPDMVSDQMTKRDAHPGNEIVYIFAISNLGPGTAHDLTFVVDIAEEVVDLTTYRPLGMRCVLNEVDGAAAQYLCVLDQMPPRLTYNIAMRGHLRADTPIGTYYQAMASALTSTDDLALANNIVVNEDTTQ